MTRRERHLRIIESFGVNSQSYRFERDRIMYRPKLAAFTDEAVEDLARNLMRSYRHSQELNKQNRELAKARGKA